MALNFTENNLYTNFDEKVRKTIKNGSWNDMSKLKIVDLSKYVDKRFKPHCIQALPQGEIQHDEAEDLKAKLHLESETSSNNGKSHYYDDISTDNNNNKNYLKVNINILKKQIPIINETTKAFIFNNNHNEKDNRGGFIIIPNCLSPEQQIFWSYHVLNDLSQPHICKSNIKPAILFEKNLYRKYVEECSHEHDDASPKRKTSFGKADGKYKKKIEALKYTTFGHHFDFENKKYSSQHYANDNNINETANGEEEDDEWYNDLPPTLGILASHIIHSLGITGSDGLPFQPDTSIVNYFINNDRKAGHKNDAEYDKFAPVVGISLLNDGIFLLGGETKDVQPIPILLHSGDIFIMNGKSRQVVHGISCILKNTVKTNVLDGLVNHTLSCITLPNHEQRDDLDKKKTYTGAMLKKYLNTLRICINIRQVFQRRDEAKHKFYFLKNHEMTYY